VSVTAKNNAYIVLCEGWDQFSSACYWIILGGWHNKDSGGGGRCAIRRCPHGVNKAGTYPTEPCKTPVHINYVSINIKCELMCAGVAVSVPGGYGKKCCLFWLMATLIEINNSTRGNYAVYCQAIFYMYQTHLLNSWQLSGNSEYN
jgi:hypothetical protein